MTIISKELIFKTFDRVKSIFPAGTDREICQMVAVNLCTDIETVAHVVAEREKEAA